MIPSKKQRRRKRKQHQKITALFMESDSPEIQASQLLLNQVMANESVSLKDLKIEEKFNLCLSVLY